MVSTFIGLLDIQSWWEIPCIAHFCSLFSSAFNLPDIDIEDLESALLTDGTDDTVGLLPELIVSLLHGIDVVKGKKSIVTTSNYQMFLRRCLRYYCRQHNTENYFDTDTDFQSLPLRNKLLVLYSLCHFRLESGDVQPILSNLESDSLRVEPLGYDSKNSSYWYFYGTRLYREDTKSGSKNTVWQVICFTEEDWQNLATKFQNSSGLKERALYNILAENFLPKLPQLFRERERLRRKKLLQVRTSVRIRALAEEKDKVISKEGIEEIEREKLEERLKLEAVNKLRSARTRRRSQSSSTASGISTYASSIRASTNSSDFLYQREKFCLSPDVISPKTLDENAIEDLTENILNEETIDRVAGTPKEIPIINGKLKKQKVRRRKNISKESDHSPEQSDNSFIQEEDKENNCLVGSNSESELSCADSNSSGSHLEMAPTTNIKLPGRQTNNSLSSLTGNIFLPTVFGNNTSSTSNENTKNKEKPAPTSVNTDNIQKKKKSKSAEVTNRSNSPPKTPFLSFTETDEVLQIGMHKVLVYVKNHRDAWPFMDPVEEDIAPRYYSIIRRPMDLLKMEEKLDNGEYAKFSDFRNDFKLIVNNCRLYNGQNNEYTEMVNNLQEAFDKATKKYFDQNSSDEEANVGYLDSKMNVFREKYFNKNNTAKVAQKEVSKKGKEKRDKSLDEVSCEKTREEDVTEGSRANKRKRKDKDKRRKKKSKTKPLLKTDEEDNDDEYSDDNEVQDTDISDIDINHAVHDKTRSKLSTGKKMPEHPKRREVSPISVNKKSRTKPGSSKHIEKEKDKKISVNKGKSNHAKKELKSSKKNVKRNSAQSETEDNSPSDGVEDQVNRTSEKEFSSDNSLIDYPIQTKTHKKHSSSHHQVSSSSKNKKPSSEKIKSTNKSNKTEKENQNTKSKCKKDITSSSESAGKLKDLPKDNKINSNNNKKKKNKTKKQEKAASEESQVREGEDYDSISRSPSPLFKIDLHKKYAKSASSKLEDEISDTSKKQPAKKSVEVDDLASILSRSVSRSPNRANSEHSNGPETSKSEMKDSKKKENKKSSSPQTSGATQEPDTKLPLFMDKYDLIKHRRNRNTDEKWNQIVKEAEKIKDNKKSTQNKSSITAVPSKEKNQKLRETIEKLKVKNAKSKERSVLIDEIFGVKPSQEIRDEKTIFEKLRETCLDSKAPVVKKIVEVAKKVETEFDFVEELAATASIKGKKKEAANQEKPNSTPVKKSPTKKQTPPSISKKSANKTNLEALELETEQTLKDINRWLEHTPRFPEFSSASNSPSRYNLLDDFDAVASKLDPNDFRRPVPITPSKVDSVPKLTETFEEIVDPKKEVVIPDLIPPIAINTNELVSAIPGTNSPNISQQKPKEAVNVTTTQLLPHPPPPPPHIKSQQQKETKRKTLKEKLSATNRRKDLLRTIDRLQPGKTKGNLISNMHNVNKPDELFPLGAAAKIKEVKNSLVVKTDETAPKLSLGSVLNTKGFGLGQLHNFADNVSNELKLSETISSNEVEEKKEEVSPVHELIDNSEEVSVKNVEAEGKIELKIEKASATPNLSAWFKAFGAPKKSKKSEEEEKKSENIDNSLCAQEKAVTPEQPNSTANSFSILKSPPTNENFPLPAPRQRKASTGSTISERSSFSQDPDSPRIGIDDRFGAYTGPYPSPIGASPIMVSPKPEELGKPTSPYPLNGAIKVGFYQDTTTKSSPEKSCSPRELPSPYPQYSQHIYSSASSPNITNDIGASYGGCYNPTGDQSKTPNYQNATSTTLYDQYKQPQSQESDYNSSMSPGTNPNSPYQQPQNSPYQQHQNSPYQQAQNSPYQQPQNSPFQNQSGATTNMMPTQSPNSQQQSPVPQPQVQQPQIAQQQQQQCDSAAGQNTPYQQTTSSSYQQPTSSPYNQQNSSSSYQQSQQPQPQVPISYGQQPNTNQTIEAPQQNTEHAFAQKNSQYSIHDNSTQFQQANQNQMPSFEPEVPKRPPSIINKIQTQSEWNNQLDIPNQRSQSSSGSLASLNPLSTTHISQLNTPPLQSESQDANKTNALQYQEANAQYQQYAAANKDLSKTQQSIFGNELSLDMIQHRQMSSQEQLLKSQTSAVKRSQEPETELLDLGYSDPQNNKIQKRDLEKPFDSTLNKHQQMFDSFLGSMTGKNLGFGKPLDISTSKAFEMFNRAATMGFSKDFPNSLMTVNKTDSIPSASTASSASHQSHQMTHQAYQVNSNKTMDASSIVGANKPVNMANNTYNQQQQQIPISQNDSAKLQSFQNIHPNVVDNNKLHQQQASALFTQKIPQQQPQPAPYPSSLVQNPGDKINNELVIPNPRQDQVGLPRNQHLNMDLSNYKPTYNNPSAMLEPLRNLNHPLAMMDETMLGLQNTSAGGYYDKNIPPAHIFSKNIGQQMYQNPSPYVSREQQNPGAYAPPVTGVPASQSMDGIDPKVSKRTKKKKSSTPTPIELVNNQAQNTMLSGQSQLNLQPQPHQNTQSQPPNSQNQQGFQLYAGLKTAGNPATSNNDASAISLKTAASMVPGSAFNFGPSPTGLGLSTGIYGDNTGYLEEFRGAPNPYYIPPGHRATPDTKAEAPVNTGTPTASSYHQFLTHPQSRGSYPFMNSPQLDPNSPIYQQYLQRQEEFRARMMLNPGLLGPGTATGYPQTGYRPTLGMPKHYDMNRQSWF